VPQTAFCPTCLTRVYRAQGDPMECPVCSAPLIPTHPAEVSTA
jgi:hypothetical protein